ncbi:MAG TPA: CorA family divalent cation transporter, partial [Daejeonella sp.]|nr:CorA family divalent cation transporter [Daejeonella sp.]
KIFTVATVAFMPPTLIASVYGMNFKIMPELDWDYGYVFAISLMVLSSVLTLIFFKKKNWL